MNKVEIEVLENEEMWAQRAVDCPESVLLELKALSEQKQALVTGDKYQQVSDVEGFKESDE